MKTQSRFNKIVWLLACVAVVALMVGTVAVGESGCETTAQHCVVCHASHQVAMSVSPISVQPVSLRPQFHLPVPQHVATDLVVRRLDRPPKFLA